MLLTGSMASIRSRLFGWLRRDSDHALTGELRQMRDELSALRQQLDRVKLWHESPMRTFVDQADHIAEQLRLAANHVGRGVMVGRDVILWGGKVAGATGLELHDHVRLYEDCRLVIDQLCPSSGIVLEDYVQINFGGYIDGSGGVRIRRRTILGPNVVIVSSSHRIDPNLPVWDSGKDFGQVDIGENVWIGANTVIRMGITIGERAVVGAGSVVTSDVPARAIVAGNPARVVRMIGDAAPSSRS
jgi:acetyltransferase-like isoleucine patch superfamily enzyme